MEQNRGSWGSNLGFILAAIGSAVGLGNIWGFPYKMGKSGGFTFLIVYILLAVFVGVVIMTAELAIGRKTQLNVVDAYKTVSKKFKWIGWLAMIAPFLIMSFYSVLGGYCIQYMSLNLAELSFGIGNGMFGDVSGGATFGAMLSSPWGCVIFTAAFMIICMLIVKGGVSGGIEKFNEVGMPALFVMLLIIIVRALSLPGAGEGLKFMFVPGYAVEAGFIASQPDFISVLATAGGQMFFSLSLAMGAMVTYGSYLDEKESLSKNAGIIVFSDTMVALLAGVAVIPAAVANGIANGVAYSDIQLSGPKLLFVTLQDVFSQMGTFGPLFGVIFYGLVLIAAISSAISLMEVLATFFIDRARAKGKDPNRTNVTVYVSIAIMAEALLVAICCLGNTGIAPANILGLVDTPMYATWNDCWLDFMDFFSEGVAMPLGAMLMSLMIGWELKPKFALDEVHKSAEPGFFDKFFAFSIKVICPIVMAFVFAGQLIDFISPVDGSYSVKTVCYIIPLVILVLYFIYTVAGKKKENK
ncbi:MAG: sodium-dependent transporter [Lachnospiraceae bacterium]|nr:sodium-dependent transporter [Lachnospiraceae bacterium]